MTPLLSLVVAAQFVGNHACRTCHASLVARYEQTPMARTTGPVKNVPTGKFRHAASGNEYSISRNGAVTVRRTGQAPMKQQFDFAIGSGAAGFSYLLFRDGLLFQAPVTWYSQANKWDAAPGHRDDRTMAWTKPVEPSCLMCHASQVTPVFGTQNRYVDPPFQQSGVACERCHGPGSDHVQGKAAMVRPERLDPERRDDVCKQCHLLPESRIPRVGRQFAEYRAGQRLADFVAYFVYDDPAGPALRTASHFEKLAASACKRGAGDRLWCGTCHSPHRQNAKNVCAECHTPDPCKRGPDCVACHMPKSKAVDAGHASFTDHAISRKPSAARASGKVWRLRPFGPGDAGDRELGLAYAEAFSRTGDERQKAEALHLLNK